MSRRSSVDNEANPVIDPKLREFSLYNNSLSKLLNKLSFRNSSFNFPKVLPVDVMNKKQETNLSKENIKLLNEKNKDQNEKGVGDESLYEILNPPKYYNSKKINNTEFILSFDYSLSQKLKIPVAGKSILELFSISESREVIVNIDSY